MHSTVGINLDNVRCVGATATTVPVALAAIRVVRYPPGC